MEVNENTKDMALAIALGMIIYEKARKSIPLEVTPTKEQVVAQAELFWNEVQTGADIGAKTNDLADGIAQESLDLLISENDYNERFCNDVNEIVEAYAKGAVREGVFRGMIESLVSDCFTVAREKTAI